MLSPPPSLRDPPPPPLIGGAARALRCGGAGGGAYKARRRRSQAEDWLARERVEGRARSTRGYSAFGAGGPAFHGLLPSVPPAAPAMEAVGALLAGCPVAGLAGGLGVTVCAAAGLLLYKIARRKKPTHMTVNCWFCNQDTVVPYGNRNCWDCPYCEQYNGFQEGKYDEEIEVYKHHLEQTYKLCRPCQAAVEYYIKHQNRQLRALLLSHHFKRRETDKPYMQSFCSSSSSSSMSTPTQVIILRFLTFLSCAFLVLMALYGSGDPFSLKGTAPAPMESGPTAIRNGTGASPAAASENRTLLGVAGWWELLHLLPEQTVKNLSVAWTYGRNHQIAVVVLGLVTCLLAMLLAGRIRLRRIDAFASVLWLLVMGLHLAEKYLKADTPSWLDTAKFGTTSLCCLVGFTAAVATRKSTGQRRYRPRRFLSGDSVALFPNGSGIGFPCSAASPSVFIPTPPSILQLTNQQFFRSPRRASSSSLPGRLNRALSLGTIPSLARTDSGYLFSGSRPASQGSQSKESPASGKGENLQCRGSQGLK
nr:transmembrane protein 201 isoform X4 [Chrysemys picta bellii]